MAADNNNWDDAGFDPEQDNESGFLSSGQQPRKRVAPAAQPSQSAKAETAKTTTSAKGEVNTSKQRSALFWFGTVALIVLLVAVVGGGIYYLTQPSAEEEAFMAFGATDSEEPVAMNSDSDDLNGSPAESLSSPTTDSAQHDEEALDLLFGEEETTPAKASAPKSSAPSEPLASSTKANNTKTAPAKVATPKQTAKPQPTPAIKPEKDITSAKPSATPPQPKVQQAPAPKGGELYVIQVFSSPSRQDADERLQLLRSQNVSNAYITEQLIKGESWYRVRFGQFGSRKEAEEEAIRLGLRQPWIARIR